MGFYLYQNRSKKVIEVGVLKETSPLYSMTTHIKPGAVEVYNGHYSVSDDRKRLKKLAVEIRERWLSEAASELALLTEVKIKNKY